MNTDDFDKLWRLFASLFPAAVKKKGANAKAVWERAMQPYAQKMAARANPTMNGQNGVRAQ